MASVLDLPRADPRPVLTAAGYTTRSVSGAGEDPGPAPQPGPCRTGPHGGGGPWRGWQRSAWRPGLSRCAPNITCPAVLSSWSIERGLAPAAGSSDVVVNSYGLCFVRSAPRCI